MLGEHFRGSSQRFCLPMPPSCSQIPGDMNKFSTVTGKAQLPWGLGVWAGANVSQYRPNGSDTVFVQFTPVLGAFYSRDGVGAELAITKVIGSDETVDSTWVGTFAAGFSGDILGATLGLRHAAALRPDRHV